VESELETVDRRCVVVTGAGGWIGSSVATTLAHQALPVGCLDVDLQGARRIARVISAAGGRALPVHCDVRSRASVEDAFSELRAGFGGVCAVINNAMVWEASGPLLEIEDDRWEDDLRMLLSSYRTVAAAALPDLRAGDSIVNISSVHGLLASAGWGTYDVAKAAVIQMTRVLAWELGPSGVRVNAVAPGNIAKPADQDRYLRDPALAARHRSIQALGRIGTPDDIAGVVAFLISPDSAFVTGHTVVADGGMTTALQLQAVNDAFAAVDSLDG
jgi:NAD(P)-dependent dehydrogenase (short-subunit alcohol dehydrogenase family)